MKLGLTAGLFWYNVMGERRSYTPPEEAEKHYSDKGSHKKRSVFHRQMRKAIQRGELPVNGKHVPPESFEYIMYEDENART
jgi:hypothetical protein